MQIDKLFAYHLQVAQDSVSIEGGDLEVTAEVRSIFEPAFLGAEKKGPRKQPFHFNFGGRIRANSTRDHVLGILADNGARAVEHCEALAKELQDIIDERIGDLLFTVAAGWEPAKMRCVFWVYPAENPIQFFSDRGKPKIAELRHAFSRRSHYRKAVFLEGPVRVTRNDFLRGELVDSTRQGRSRSVAHYWVERFLHGQVELSSPLGIRHLSRGLKEAQKVASTSEEIASVVSAYTRLLSNTLDSTTLTQFAQSLSGKAKTAYLSVIPTTIERDAVFEIDQSFLRKRVSRIVYILTNRILVIFPTDESLDPNHFIREEGGQRILHIEAPIEATRYE